jgi:superfamily I DNA and/or RNA helicase
MSPLTVSSYFGANKNWSFDIVIFDEASQVKPEYAISAIARGKQVIVAGDSKQMPPSRFFDSNVDDDNEFGDDNLYSADLESILDEFSTIVPSIFLDWHYRSKDEALISFSNKNFYNNRLFTFPSVASNDKSMGVNFIYCEDGVWESREGNKNEAEKIARIIFEHIKTQPEKSLGVIAFGKSQENALIDAVDKLRDMHPDIEHFFNENNKDSFFIKNLENVQGDERDRIIISCGYGKDAKGFFAMRFGPLTADGGGRRLNVAASRARQEMTIVSSFRANEIRGVEENKNRKLIRDFIDYAERGLPALIGDNTSVAMRDIEPEFDSAFEEDVYAFLVNKGYSLRTQVGASGYKIDMAVLHPK